MWSLSLCHSYETLVRPQLAHAEIHLQAEQVSTGTQKKLKNKITPATFFPYGACFLRSSTITSTLKNKKKAMFFWFLCEDFEKRKKKNVEKGNHTEGELIYKRKGKKKKKFRRKKKTTIFTQLWPFTNAIKIATIKYFPNISKVKKKSKRKKNPWKNSKHSCC